ncbi:MAG: hypothetical protein RR047_02560 [Bacilli bacterium]
MKLNFIVNDYLLTWNLLFGASISEDSYNYKTKLWKTYKKQYNALTCEDKVMLSDIKNFIPDDDTLYNTVFETELFTTLKKETEKHRLYLMKIWDSYKKDIIKSCQEIIRLNFDNTYNILVVHPSMDTVYYDLNNKERNIVWGRKADMKDATATLISILYTVVRYQIGNQFPNYKEIVQAILELAINNELYTRLKDKSNYLAGDASLSFLKRQIYPYWLMYLGATEDSFTGYMMRDKIAFDIDKYPVEANLKKLDLIQFIEFCIKNQKYIIRINQLEII